MHFGDEDNDEEVIPRNSTASHGRSLAHLAFQILVACITVLHWAAGPERGATRFAAQRATDAATATCSHAGADRTGSPSASAFGFGSAARLRAAPTASAAPRTKNGRSFYFAPPPRPRRPEALRCGAACATRRPEGPEGGVKAARSRADGRRKRPKAAAPRGAEPWRSGAERAALANGGTAARRRQAGAGGGRAERRTCRAEPRPAARRSGAEPSRAAAGPWAGRGGAGGAGQPSTRRVGMALGVRRGNPAKGRGRA